MQTPAQTSPFRRRFRPFQGLICLRAYSTVALSDTKIPLPHSYPIHNDTVHLYSRHLSNDHGDGTNAGKVWKWDGVTEYPRVLCRGTVHSINAQNSPPISPPVLQRFVIATRSRNRRSRSASSDRLRSMSEACKRSMSPCLRRNTCNSDKVG